MLLCWQKSLSASTAPVASTGGGHNPAGGRPSFSVTRAPPPLRVALVLGPVRAQGPQKLIFNVMRFFRLLKKRLVHRRSAT